MLMKTKKQRFKNLGKIFSLLFCVVAIGLTLTLADFFSSLITVGGFTFTNSDITISKYNLYAVSTASATTTAMSEQLADTCKKQGGAGYIYISDNSYYVLASMYENKADAEKVISNLKESNVSANLIEIEIKPISFANSLESQEKTALENAVNIFKTCYKKLYDISISLDTGVINEVNARLAINELASEIKTTSNNFNTLFDSKLSSNILNIKLKHTELLEVIDKIINPTASIPYTSQIKNSYCSAIFLLKDLASNLS